MANNYNDALERAKQAIIDCGSNASRKEMIYSIFPELRENEEDKIKDTLHSIICRAINDQGTPYEERVFISKKVLPYVEKLQEQKPSEWSEKDKKMLERVIDTIGDSILECDCDDTGTKARFALEDERKWLKSLPERFK